MARRRNRQVSTATKFKMSLAKQGTHERKTPQRRHETKDKCCNDKVLAWDKPIAKFTIVEFRKPLSICLVQIVSESELIFRQIHYKKSFGQCAIMCSIQPCAVCFLIKLRKISKKALCTLLRM